MFRSAPGQMTAQHKVDVLNSLDNTIHGHRIVEAFRHNKLGDLNSRFPIPTVVYNMEDDSIQMEAEVGETRRTTCDVEITTKSIANPIQHLKLVDAVPNTENRCNLVRLIHITLSIINGLVLLSKYLVDTTEGEVFFKKSILISFLK